MANLAVALREQFKRTGDVEILIEAVEVGRAAVAVTPVNHPGRMAGLSSLGLALRALAERTGGAGLLEEAIQVGRAVVAATPAGDVHRAAGLSNLGLALQAMFERTGDIQALTEAIRVGRAAVSATSDDCPERAKYLANLGGALRMLFERTGDAGLLAEAAEAGRAAVAATPEGRADHNRSVSSLGVILMRLFERTGDAGLLAEAVQAGRAAVAATPQDDPEHAVHMSNLAPALLTLFERTGDAGLLAEAVQAGRAAVAATPQDDPGYTRSLSNLGLALRTLFARNQDIAVLTEAAKVGRAAVTLTPGDHPDRSAFLNNLGNSLRGLSDRTGDAGLLAEAMRCYAQAADNAAAPILARVDAFRHIAALAARDVAGSEKALAAAEAAVALLPELAPRTLARGDREHQLSRLGSLAGVAAATAVAAGRPERAVELLEQTRGVLVADTINARSSDLTRLRETAPDLALAFEELRDRREALDQTDRAHLVTGISAARDMRAGQEARARRARQAASDLSEARRAAQAEWTELISRIRAVNGFAGFAATPRIEELAAQSRDGPLIFICTSETLCVALILRDSADTPVQVIRLDRLTETDAHQQASRLMTAHLAVTGPDEDPASRKDAQQEILRVLAWLWDFVAAPILLALGYTTTPQDAKWPRVWWCPVGILSYLPLHAAGHHADLTADDPALRAEPRTVLDRVESSYITTVRGLAYARALKPGPTAKALIVAVDDAPEAGPLAQVAAEAAAIKALIPAAHLLPFPTRESVLAALPHHSVAHFACHAYTDRSDPASGRLILHDHQTAPLTVADISALRLANGLAYLSACDTAVTTPQLADESAHITGAFHLAGYQHVIGTSWPVSDHAARYLATEFYTCLTGNGTVSPDVTRASRALHHAIRQARARYPAAPTLWAAHTHTGM
jgi:CHAT domain-containing protein